MSGENGSKPVDPYGVDRELANEKVRMIDGTTYDGISHWDLLSDLQARTMAWLALMADDMEVVFDGPDALMSANRQLGFVVASRMIDADEYDYDAGMAAFFRWFRDGVSDA